MQATVRDSFRVGPAGLRTLAFEVANAVKIDAARVDGQPAELLFADSPRGTTAGAAVTADDAQNTTFLIVPSGELAAGSEHQIEFEEHGSVISPAGNDVYFVAARANWYPRAGTGLSTYDLKFRYPKRLTLVTAGDVREDQLDGDFHITRRVTPVPIRIAGFNLGDYVRAGGSKTDGENPSGLSVRFTATGDLRPRLQPRLANDGWADEELPRSPRNGIPQHAPQPAGSPAPPNPLARLQAVAVDISSGAPVFIPGLFGPPALKNLTVSPIPGGFGQGFPGLVYLSTLSYLDAKQRPESDRGLQAQVFFSDLIEAHDVAHQWWGNIVMPAGYQDEWLSEAVANYSSLLYLEKKKGVKAMEDVLENFRDALVSKDEKGATTESAGPITWGFRSGSQRQSGGAQRYHLRQGRLGAAHAAPAHGRRPVPEDAGGAAAAVRFAHGFHGAVRRSGQGVRASRRPPRAPDRVQRRCVFRQLGLCHRNSGIEAGLLGEGRGTCGLGSPAPSSRAAWLMIFRLKLRWRFSLPRGRPKSSGWRRLMTAPPSRPFSSRCH